jgi:hypothetical protein
MNNAMSVGSLSVADIQKSIASGSWKPNLYLTNISVAQFQAPNDFVAPKVFPIVPVQLPISKYYKFSLADLARSTMKEKPKFGAVAPTVWGNTEDDYSVKVYQGLWGLDQISASVPQRAGAPGVADPRRAKAKIASEQSMLLMDVQFSQKFFKAGIWAQEFSGVTTTPSGNQFIQFDNDNSNPIEFFQQRIREMKRHGRRKPNKLCLGANTFTGLVNNKYIIERVKYGGNSANPATVNEKVIAELIGIDEVVVLESTYNSADQGADINMNYVCDPNGALLVYVPSSAAIDEPSAGYIFTWDMLGTGAYMAMSNFLGAPETHTEFVEALCSFDMKQVSQDLAVYMTNCVSSAV